MHVVGKDVSAKSITLRRTAGPPKAAGAAGRFDERMIADLLIPLPVAPIRQEGATSCPRNVAANVPVRPFADFFGPLRTFPKSCGLSRNPEM